MTSIRSTHATLLSALMFTSAAAVAGGDHGDAYAGIAAGEPGKAAQVSRTIGIDMTDAMRFSPASITARQGETIRFVVRNSGQVKHELVLGAESELHEHAELMKKNPEMEHDDPGMVAVLPGKTGEVIWRFTKPGKVNFACLQPGHYDAGMKGLVTVVGAVAGIEAG